MKIVSAKYYFFIYAAAWFMSCCFVSSCENSQEEIDRYTKNKVMQEEAIKVAESLEPVR